MDDLLTQYVDESPRQGDDASPENGLGATSWQTWSDAGGDLAFSTELSSGPLAGQTLLVYGSAPVADQETVLRALTLDPVSGGVSATTATRTSSPSRPLVVFLEGLVEPLRAPRRATAGRRSRGARRAPRAPATPRA